jgi:hypothetical protein
MWPPIWVYGLGASNRKKPHGELGFLKEVRRYSTKPGRVFLTMDYEGAEYACCLFFDDHAFCEHIADLLREHCGLSIQEIGALDIREL